MRAEAFRLAGVCCRSVIVFSRLNARGTVAPPEWSNDPELVPLVLCGGWDQSNEHDRAVVAAICNKTYEEVDLAARRLASLPDAPLDLDGSIWTVRSPKDAFILTETLIGNAHQQRLARRLHHCVFGNRPDTQRARRRTANHTNQRRRLPPFRMAETRIEYNIASDIRTPRSSQI